MESFAMNSEVRRSLVIPVELIEELFEKCFAYMGCEKSVEFAILNIHNPILLSVSGLPGSGRT